MLRLWTFLLKRKGVTLTYSFSFIFHFSFHSFFKRQLGLPRYIFKKKSVINCALFGCQFSFGCFGLTRVIDMNNQVNVQMTREFSSLVNSYQYVHKLALDTVFCRLAIHTAMCKQPLLFTQSNVGKMAKITVAKENNYSFVLCNQTLQ